MARFKKPEKTLLKLIADPRLTTSVTKIREVMEDLWSSDAPRIVRDFTDHGEKHCERLAAFSVQLLNANDGRALSEREAYLLLAGIYLHDIGMQCDVTKYPDIKNAAERFGAKFEVEFSAKTANAFSSAEQRAIRANHHYLSIAWIDEAHRNGDTLMGPAAKTIPADLVDDLMDVCKHHTKHPITECGAAFKLDPNGRKRLVAALLRFADELDIDATRVSIESVRAFSVDAQNSLYWWLHNQTKIVFTATNAVKLMIWLHRRDYDEFADLVQELFIDGFQSKNRAVLDVLRQNAIPIVIDADSKVEALDRGHQLPEDIRAALRALEVQHDPLRELADELKTWLRAVRYDVGEVQAVNRRIDMIATLDQGAFTQRVLVRCVEGEINAADIDELDKILDRNTPQGWLVSDIRVSEGARQRASETSGCRAFNLADFLKQMVWGPYFTFLTTLIEKDRIPELYVDLGCYKEVSSADGERIEKDVYASLNNYITGWLTERGKAHISVLGQFGAGKTWFCRYYAYRQLERYLLNPMKERMPLLITLRGFSKALTAQQLINDALLEQYKLPFFGSAFTVFQEMNRRGKLLLILDGFDEMARQVDYQTVVDNFWELAKLVDANSKVILTSRTEYFRWAKESEKILGGKEFGRRTIVLEPPKFEVLYVETLSDEQVRQVVVRRMGQGKGAPIADRILAKPHLLDMARKPVLVELLLAAIDEVNPDVLESPAQVYLYATNKLLLRNIDTKRTFTTTADKLYFLCELAWEMIRSGDLRVHYTAIPDRIKSYFGDRIKDQHELDTWDFDLRSQTLLHRDAAGYYEFAHKSLAEFFVAIKLAAELGLLSRSFAKAYSEADGRACTIPIPRKEMVDLRATFGALVLRREAQPVVELLPGVMIAAPEKQLRHLIEYTRNMTSDAAGYTGGNLVALLRAVAPASLRKLDLHDTKLAGANFAGCDLSKTDLSGADVREVDFLESLLPAKTFSKALLNDTNVQFVFSGYERRTSRHSRRKLRRARRAVDDDPAYDLFAAVLEHFKWAATGGYGHEDPPEFLMFLSTKISAPFEWAKVKGEMLRLSNVTGVALYGSERATLKKKLTQSLQRFVTAPASRKSSVSKRGSAGKKAK